MTQLDFGEIEKEVEEQLESFFEAATDEIEKAIEAVEERMRSWIAAVVNGELSLEEFRELVEGEKDLAVLSALQQTVTAKGIAGALKNTVLEKVLEVVTGFVEEQK